MIRSWISVSPTPLYPSVQLDIIEIMRVIVFHISEYVLSDGTIHVMSTDVCPIGQSITALQGTATIIDCRRVFGMVGSDVPGVTTGILVDFVAIATIGDHEIVVLTRDGAITTIDAFPEEWSAGEGHIGIDTQAGAR